MARNIVSNLHTVGNPNGKRGRKRKPLKELAPRTRAAYEYREKVKGTKPGTGKRFAALEGALEKVPGVKTPGALTAWIGRRTYGKARFQKMAAAGRRRAR